LSKRWSKCASSPSDSANVYLDVSGANPRHRYAEVSQEIKGPHLDMMPASPPTQIRRSHAHARRWIKRLSRNQALELPRSFRIPSRGRDGSRPTYTQQILRMTGRTSGLRSRPPRLQNTGPRPSTCLSRAGTSVLSVQASQREARSPTAPKSSPPLGSAEPLRHHGSPHMRDVEESTKGA